MPNKHNAMSQPNLEVLQTSDSACAPLKFKASTGCPKCFATSRFPCSLSPFVMQRLYWQSHSASGENFGYLLDLLDVSDVSH